MSYPSSGVSAPVTMNASWESVKLVDATLAQYTLASIMSQSYGQERAFINDFFGNQPYVSVEEVASPYQHNLSQYVQDKFFTENGFKKVCEKNSDFSTSSAPVFADIEIDVGKTIRGYWQASVGYEKEGQRLLVMIEEWGDHGERQYRVMAPEEHAGLLKEWIARGKQDNFYRGKKINALAKFLELKDVSWADVILQPGVKSLLQGLVHRIIANEAIYRRNKLPLKRGFLLTGKPGNGKTSAIRVVAKEAPVTVVYVQPCHLMSAKNVRDVCQMARDLAPCILMIEDIDWIAEDRNTGDAGRVIELMNQLDGLEDFTNVITIATTNDQEKIEGAIKNRPGRFDRVITIDNPDASCREQMIHIFCKHWKMEGVEVAKVVEFTKDLSGSHMYDLCHTAADHAVEKMSLDEDGMIILRGEHFESAIKEVKDKDYSTYMKMKSSGRPQKIGFSAMIQDQDD